MIIYILKGTNYEIHQTLEKPSDIKRGETNKVIFSLYNININILYQMGI